MPMDEDHAEPRQRLPAPARRGPAAVRAVEELDRQPEQIASAREAGVDYLRRRGSGSDLRLPSWDALQKLAPEERRRVLDYFRRLTAGGGS